MSHESGARPLVVQTKAQLREHLDRSRAAGARVALVPTMGALHDGHLALVDRARELADVVVVSIFVNPLQFGAGEDLDQYPRTLDADVAALTVHDVDVVFAPSAAEMYPDGTPSTTVHAGPAGASFEGAVRPGHFDGMLTVVAKLFGISEADVACFGRKDAQQAFLVRRMVADLDLPIEIEVVPTVRDQDGLARSSRNRYLSESERAEALVLHDALDAAARAGLAGAGAAGAVAAGAAVFAEHPGVVLDYFAIVDPATFEPVGADAAGDVLAITAARLGTTRLLDNAPLTLVPAS
ncbi:pantoate--beta-alanine ligase [Agromyces seonyuensis]|uniref:Pantothenate synthetase n=1 Tax=Agromyces seonyuensis TaxID=2662446 RepID=A0A6I4NXL1_9MICO|nr:pantoate--beta-alanine ligase [Agromyces seonyuensis]